MKISNFFIYLVVVIAGVAIIDVMFRLIFTPFFDNPPKNTKAEVTYKFVSHKAPASVIVLGASRASHHYISLQMEESLGVVVYNYGWDGRCTLYQYLCLLRGIENGGLNTVILDLSEAQLSKEWVDERISDLYPYYWKSDTVRMMVDEVEKKRTAPFMMSALIQYNSQYLNLIAPITSIKGYIPLPYTGEKLDISKNKETIQNRNKDYWSPIAINYLNKMAILCKKNKIKFIVCLSPSLEVRRDTETLLTNLCTQRNIECWDLTRYVDDTTLFSDYNHLNDKGAEIFTDEIVSRLKCKL